MPVPEAGFLSPLFAELGAGIMSDNAGRRRIFLLAEPLLGETRNKDIFPIFPTLGCAKY